MIAGLREAPWVTDMRDHFQRHGFYRREDLERLLGKPWESVQIGEDGQPRIVGRRP